MFRGRICVLFALVFWVVSGAHASALEIQELRVDGRVVDASNQPVAGAAVHLYSLLDPYEQGIQMLRGNPWGESLDRDLTDEQGRYRVEAPEWGLFLVVVEVEGFLPMAHRLAPLLGSMALPQVTLTPDEGTVVRVLDADGKPAAGAQVVLRWFKSGQWWDWDRRETWHPALRMGRTSEDGTVTVPYLSEEVLDVAVFHAEHWPWTNRVRPGDAGVSVELRGRRTPRAVQVLEGEASCGEPLVMRRSWPYVMADNGGRVSLPEAQEPLRLTVLTADGQRRDAKLLPGETSLTLPSAEWIRGQVAVNDSGQPVEGAWVWDDYTLQQARTDAEGHFRWPTQSSEPRLRAAKPGLHDQSRPGHHVNKKDAEGIHRIALHGDAGLRGRVLDDQGSGIAGVTLEVRPEFSSGARHLRTLRTDSEGFFQVHGLNAAFAYQVHAEADGYAAAQVKTEPWPLMTSRGQELTLTLNSGVALTGRVLDGASRPVEGVRVELFGHLQPDGKPFQGSNRQGQSAPSTTTDADGRFEVTKMAFGQHTLALRAQGFAPHIRHAISVDAEKGTQDLGDMRLEEEAVLDLLVLDGEGSPVSGVEVFDLGVAGSRRTYGYPKGVVHLLRRKGKTDGEGRLQFDGLQPGQSMTFYFQHPQFMRYQRDVALPQDGVLEVTLDRGSTLRGRVVDAAGRGLPNAALQVRSEPVVEGQRSAGGFSSFWAGKSGDDGRFEISGVESRKITIMAQLDGYQDGTSASLFPDGGDIEGVTVQLLETLELQGKVVDENGAAVAEARVTTWHGRGPSRELSGIADSDSEGRFRLATLPGDDVQIEAKDSQGRRVSRTMVLSRGMAPVTLVLEQGQVLSGRVVDGEGQAIEGAEVRVQGPTYGRVISDADGQFLVALELGGRYTVAATRDDMGRTVQTVEVPEGRSVDDLELVLESAGRIVGQVTGLEAEDMSRLFLSASQQHSAGTSRRLHRTGRVDSDGALIIEGIIPGTWRVTASLEGSARRAMQEVQVDGYDDVVVELDLGERGFTLSGQVFHNGEPAPSVSIYPASVRTDGDGRFRIDGLEPGPYQLMLSGSWGNHEYAGEIYADDDVQIAIDTFEISGQVVDGGGQPLEEVGVQCLDPDSPGSRLTAAAMGDGRFRIPGLKPGTYQLMAQKSGYGGASMRVEVTGDRADLVFTLNPTEAVALTVQGPDARAVDHLAVVVLDAADQLSGIQNLVPEAEGHFLLDFLPAGRSDLVVVSERSAPGRLSVDVPGGPYALQLQPGTRLVVNVPDLLGDRTVAHLDIVDAEGQPFSPRMFGMPSAQWPIQMGRFQFPLLPPGTWQLTVTAEDGRQWQGSAVTSVEATAEVVLP